MLYTIPLFKFDYTLGQKIKINKNLRIEEDIKKFIELEIDSLYKKGNFDKLKY